MPRRAALSSLSTGIDAVALDQQPAQSLTIQAQHIPAVDQVRKGKHQRGALIRSAIIRKVEQRQADAGLPLGQLVGERRCGCGEREDQDDAQGAHFKASVQPGGRRAHCR
jgi:hypothetical protein